jgi:hypothetical protein
MGRPGVFASVLFVSLASCGFKTQNQTGSAGAGGSGGMAGTGSPLGTAGTGGSPLGTAGQGGAGLTVQPPCNPCTDFPPDPIIDTTGTPPPSDVATTFGPGGSGSATGGPCLIEPEPDSLFPRNWLRPRFRFSAPAGQTVFEIRIHAQIETNDLVVYTTQTTWTMPGTIWSGISKNAADMPLTVTVRGLDTTVGTPAVGTSEQISIAPVDANGTIVYWTTSGGSALKGFNVGDESVTTVITPANTPGKCVGCHSSTPGGDYIGFSNSSDPGNGDPSHIEIRSGTTPANQPPFLTASATTLLARVSQELPTFSPAHWDDTTHDHVVVFMHADSTSAAGQATHLLWIDLEAATTTQGMGWGEFMRMGDPGGAVAYPFFRHDGTGIVYVSAPTANPSGILQHGDLYQVEYGNRAGGAATPIAGAATTDFSEFYPALSADDHWVAFNRLTDGQNSYDNAQSEIFAIQSAGGTARRLKANDPGACLGKTSPGITNSWPKWAPVVNSSGARRYYWYIFSSTRGDGGNPQLYAAALVEDETGNVTDTPALYLWNQPANENNHTPAWDKFKIPTLGFIGR